MRRTAAARRSAVRAGCAAVAVALLLAWLSGCTGDGSGDKDDGSPAARANPLLAAGGGVRNVTFYYQGTTPLEAGRDLSKLGKPAVVVTTPKADEKSAVAAIHSTGAKAYRYVQFFWAPDDEAFEGINLAKHPEWAFCGQGDKPLLGRVTGTGSHKARWYFIDANEEAARAALARALKHLKDQGWDGVMFDRGGAALTNARDVAGHRVWYSASSCTGQPLPTGGTLRRCVCQHARGREAQRHGCAAQLRRVALRLGDSHAPRCVRPCLPTPRVG